jgi:O-antigen/teichoic acid export membrane protein
MNTITRNALTLFTQQIAVWGLSFLVIIVVPNVLGEVDFGRWAFAMAFVGFFGLVGSLGTYTFMLKTTARDASQVGLYAFNGLLMKLSVCGVLGLVAIGTGALLGYESTTMLLVVAASLSMILTLSNEVVQGAMHGMERMARPALWTVVQQYVGVGLSLGVIAVGGGVVGYGFALVPALLIPLVANLHALRGPISASRHVDFALWKTIAVGGLPYLAWSAILFVYGSIDMLMLRPTAGEVTVGWYSLAYRWVSLPVLVASTASTAMFPQLSAHGVDVNERFLSVSNRAIKFVAFSALPVAAGVAVLARDIIDTFYDGKFQESVPLIIILGLHIPIVVVDVVLGMVLIASDRQKQWVIVGCIAAVLNPLLNLAAIPLTIRWYDNGAIGAATVTVFTELLMMSGALKLRPRGVLDRSTLSYIARSAVATVAVVAVCLGVYDAGIIVKVLLGGVTYVIAALALRTASWSQVALLRSRLRHPQQAPEAPEGSPLEPSAPASERP